MNIETFISIVEPYTMTSKERIISLYQSLEYIRENKIKGDFVECGVWKGGNILGCLEYLKYYNLEGSVWLYDTFSGMTEPTDVDIDLNGRPAHVWVSITKQNYGPNSLCYCSLEDVKSILDEKNYPNNKINYVVGDINQMLDDEENVPEKIALLRLDTDWYESTKKEMEKLFPKLSEGGVLIVDDYGHWSGSKKAVDEYLSLSDTVYQLEKIDYTGVRMIK